MIGLPKIKLLGLTKCDVDERWEYHNYYSYFSRLYYITAGGGTIEFPEEKRSYELKSDHIYFIPPHCRFSLSAKGRCHQEYNIEFLAAMEDGIDPFSYYNYLHEIPAGKDDLDRFDRLFQLNPSFSMLHGSDKMNSHNYFKSYQNRDFSAIFETEMIILDLMKRLILTASVKQRSHEIESLNQIIRLLYKDKFARTMKISEGAEIAGYSESYFSSLFIKHTGLSFRRYQLFKKLDRAEELLRNSSNSIKEIAYECGFESAIQLNQLFGKYLGDSPKSYRYNYQC